MGPYPGKSDRTPVWARSLSPSTWRRRLPRTSMGRLDELGSASLLSAFFVLLLLVFVSSCAADGRGEAWTSSCVCGCHGDASERSFPLCHCHGDKRRVRLERSLLSCIGHRIDS